MSGNRNTKITTETEHGDSLGGALYRRVAGEIAASGHRLALDEPRGGLVRAAVREEEEKAFACLFDARERDTVAALKEAFMEPENLSLAEDARLVVVDPSPNREKAAVYRKVGAEVLSDGRFAARVLLEAAREIPEDELLDDEKPTLKEPEERELPNADSPNADSPNADSPNADSLDDDLPDDFPETRYVPDVAGESDASRTDPAEVFATPDDASEVPPADDSVGEGREDHHDEYPDDDPPAGPVDSFVDSSALLPDDIRQVSEEIDAEVPEEDGEEDLLSLSGTDRERLYRVQQALTSRRGEKALTPEQREALAAVDSLGRGGRARMRLGKMLGLASYLDDLVTQATNPPSFGRISFSEASALATCPFPGVALFGNAKGGSGKSFCAASLAAVLAKVCRPRRADRGLRVLLIEQNYSNSDVRERVRVKTGSGRGLAGFIRDLRASGASEGAADRLPAVSSYARQVEGMEDFYVLLITRDTAQGEEFKESGKVTPYEMDLLYEAAGAEFDLIVVDLPNGLPQEENILGESIRFWISLADAIFVTMDPSPAIRHGARFLSGTRHYLEELDREAREQGLEGNVAPALVPVLNRYLPEDGTPYERAIAELGADHAIRLDDEDDYPAITGGLEGGPARYHPVPDDRAVYEFCRERRQIAVESPMFAAAFLELAYDFLQRVKSRREGYFGASSDEDDDEEAYYYHDRPEGGE